MPLLSVIVPIYNVEKYLKQCIESVIKQQLDSYELILVDDGSTDSSKSICDNYSKNNANIKVFHKKNEGASSARNYGLKKASGKYVLFLDSDDWWNPQIDLNMMLEYAVRHPKIEMCLFTSYDYIEGKGYFQRNEHKNLKEFDTSSAKSFYRSLLNNGNLEVAAYTKILKRDFLINNSLFFNTKLICEDNEWMIRLLRCLRCVEVLDYPLYIYRAGRDGSVTGNIKQKNITDMLEIVQDSIDFYDKNTNDVKNEELCFASYLWFCALGLANRLNHTELQEVKPLFKNTSSVCAYSNSKKTKLSNLVYKIFGFNLTVKILGAYLKRKKNDTAKTKVAEEIGQIA